MSLSNEACIGARQRARNEVKGATMCVVSDLSFDFLDQDFDLNKSYPCAQRPVQKKSVLALQRRYYSGSLTGERKMPHRCLAMQVKPDLMV